MRKNVSLARLIELNKENLSNNQLFIDLIEEKVHKKQVEMQERHLTKQAGEENVIKKGLVITTNDYLSKKKEGRNSPTKELSSFEGVRISDQLDYTIVEMQRLLCGVRMYSKKRVISHNTSWRLFDIMKRKKACMIFYQNTLFLLFIDTAITFS
ncbi:hypothetical protein AM232_03170 [Bacillus sp. FJAT-21352]|nr:hypothetical protein AM232_03170 [Bacillus sp. FJAT-21352]